MQDIWYLSIQLSTMQDNICTYIMVKKLNGKMKKHSIFKVYFELIRKVRIRHVGINFTFFVGV